jgi:hypothetical protein
VQNRQQQPDKKKSADEITQLQSTMKRTARTLKRPAQSRREIVLFSSPRKLAQLPSLTETFSRPCLENIDRGVLKRPSFDVDGMINQWLDSNEVYRTTVQSWKGHRNSLKAELQAAATPVPTSKYSTAGLLLETNPYSASDELIRINEGKELDDIVV